MALLGDRLGYHVLHAVMFVAIPVFLWWDLRDEPRDTRLAGTALGVLLRGGLFGPARIERRHQLARRRLLRQSSRWAAATPRAAVNGGADRCCCLGLTLALYTHAAFAIYAASSC